MWSEHIAIFKRVLNNNNIKSDAAMILADSLNDDKPSLYSQRSIIKNSLKNSPKTIPISSISASFNKNWFSFKKTQPVNTDMISSYLESYYNLVDKLYPISPKKTYHLVTKNIVIVSIDDIDDEENNEENVPARSIIKGHNELNCNNRIFEDDPNPIECRTRHAKLNQLLGLELEPTSLVQSL